MWPSLPSHYLSDLIVFKPGKVCLFGEMTSRLGVRDAKEAASTVKVPLVT